MARKAKARKESFQGAKMKDVCRGDFEESYNSNSKAVEWVPCVAAVNGACCS